jgi:hypothetical protein
MAQKLEQQVSILDVVPPYLWPEPRWHAHADKYQSLPPFKDILFTSDLISGVLVGIDETGVDLIERLANNEPEIKLRLVLVLYEAGPTRQTHLRQLLNLSTSKRSSIQLRVLPIRRSFSRDSERMNLLPTIAQAHDSRSGRTFVCVGSTGNFGGDESSLHSCNIVAKQDAALCDKWRRWFQFVFSSAFPLTDKTTSIPFLVPAPGDPEARRLWEEFEQNCKQANEPKPPVVDSGSGEVIEDAGGQPVIPWDDGATALSPLAQKLQEVYSQLELLTVDELTRTKPLVIPIRPELFGLRREDIVGAITHRQSLSLQILDEATTREINKLRSVSDLFGLVSYQISKGNRLIPIEAKPLLTRDIEKRNEEAELLLDRMLGGRTIEDFIKTQEGRYRKDLDEMYRHLGRGEKAPDSTVNRVLLMVSERLVGVREGSITPSPMFNRVEPPRLTREAPVSHWSQPFCLMSDVARRCRSYLTDGFFARQFTPRSFSIKEWLAVMDVFDDSILKKEDVTRARRELLEIDGLEESNEDMPKKCEAIWEMMTR